MFSKLFKSLGVWIFIAMVIGGLVGAWMGPSASMFAPLGHLFMKLIKMLVVPLVTVSIISGAAALGATKSSGRIGAATLLFIFGTTAISVLIAMALGTWLRPGDGFDISALQQEPAQAYEAPPPQEFWPTILSMIPENPVQALTEGNILQLIFFGLFIGIGISTLPEERKRPLVNALDYVLDALIWGVKVVMFTAPIGVFGLMADAIGAFGYELLANFANLLWVNVLGDLIVWLGLYPLLLLLFSRVKLKDFFTHMAEPQVVALSTSSSMATLPVNMEVCEEKLGVSKATASFVLPLGATINMTGSAVYYVVAALFMAQLYDIPLGAADYMAIGITSTVGAIGQAGVPGPSLLLVAILVSAGIPLDGLPILYAFDRLFDMLRTWLNITGDAVCAMVVDGLNKKHV